MTPIHLKFGYEAAKERAAIQTELEEQGLTGTDLHFAVVREYERRHADDPSYKETSERILAEAKARSGSDTGLTREEAEHLLELLGGANHPLSQSIAGKMKELLNG